MAVGPNSMVTIESQRRLRWRKWQKIEFLQGKKGQESLTKDERLELDLLTRKRNIDTTKDTQEVKRVRLGESNS